MTGGTTDCVTKATEANNLQPFLTVLRYLFLRIFLNLDPLETDEEVTARTRKGDDDDS